jgi:cyclic beta-1,2-glucan synthetase
MGDPPGVRENGGQYTHAALWVAMAFARLGDGRRAVEILEMLNPVDHTRAADDCAVYGTEPYVAAAEVYSLESRMGCGGWTGYTGSAGYPASDPGRLAWLRADVPLRAN